MEGYRSAMRRYAVFRGRASRTEFGQFVGILMLAEIAAFILDGLFTGGSDVLLIAINLIHLLPWLAVCARRLQDLDRSGWLCLIAVVPYLGFVMIVLGGPEGTVGPNRYGPDPIARGYPGEPVALAPLPSPVAFEPRPASEPSPDFRPPPASPGRDAPVPAPVPVPAPPMPAPPFDLLSELERLAALRTSGALSEVEFEVLKAQALARGRRA